MSNRHSNIGLLLEIDRPLTNQEEKENLDVKISINIEPHYLGSLVRLNTSFLESVDIGYQRRGFQFLLFSCVLLTTLFIVYLFTNLLFTNFSAHIQQDGIGIYLFLSVVLISSISYSLYHILKESFTYTHFPIRLNRKTRLVHVFRSNGTILTVPWDKLVFTIGRSRRRFGIQQTYIASHVLDPNGRTIRETFVLGGYLTADLEKTLSLWEFFRRYMEEGPEAVIKDIPIYCLPIDKQKESFDLGQTMIRFSQWSSGGLLVELFSIFLFFEAFARWVAMMTCRIPVWPKEIEDACQIEPDDPFVRDSSTNSHRQSELGPESMRFSG